MKINHETFRDDKDFGDNTFKNTTPLEKKDEPAQVKKRPKLPKRKWSFGGETLLYLLHFLLIPVSLLPALLLSHMSLFLMIIPYSFVIAMAFKLGGAIHSKGLNHILWNLSVLLSSYTHANMRHLRSHCEKLAVLGIVFMALGGMLSGLLVIVGLVLFLTSAIFFLAERETEEMASYSKWMSWALFGSGVIALFINPLMAHGVLTLSLAGNWLYEKWKDYEWQLD